MTTGATPEDIYYSTLCRMDALALGGLTATLLRATQFRQAISRYAVALLVLAGSLFAAIGLTSGFFATNRPAMVLVGYTGTALAFALVVAVGVAGTAVGPAGWFVRVCSARPIRAIGRVSYGMYVLHLPLFLLLKPTLARWVQPAGAVGPLIVAIVMIGLSYVAGLLSYLTIERWFLRRKPSFARRGDSLPAPSTPRT